MSLHSRLQQRIQHDGWEEASATFQFLRHRQLSEIHQRLMTLAEPSRSQRVLDIGCGTGFTALAAADRVGGEGRVVGLDSSLQKLRQAEEHARALRLDNLHWQQLVDEQLPCADSSVDLVYCTLCLPSMPKPERALRETYRVLKPGARIALLVWGERFHCAWSSAHSLLEAETGTVREPLAFRYGRPEALSLACRNAGFVELKQERCSVLMHYDNEHDASAEALSELETQWADTDPRIRARIEPRYLHAIAPWRTKRGTCRMPAQFVFLLATKPAYVL